MWGLEVLDSEKGLLRSIISGQDLLSVLSPRGFCSWVGSLEVHPLSHHLNLLRQRMSWRLCSLRFLNIKFSGSLITHTFHIKTSAPSGYFSAPRFWRCQLKKGSVEAGLPNHWPPRVFKDSLPGSVFDLPSAQSLCRPNSHLQASHCSLFFCFCAGSGPSVIFIFPALHRDIPRIRVQGTAGERETWAPRPPPGPAPLWASSLATSDRRRQAAPQSRLFWRRNIRKGDKLRVWINVYTLLYLK